MSNRKDRLQQDFEPILKQVQKKKTNSNDNEHGRFVPDIQKKIRQMDPTKFYNNGDKEGECVPSEVEDAWYTCENIAGIKFYSNDCVAIKSGDNKDDLGTVIGLVTLKPETVYLIELSTGDEAEIAESLLDHYKTS